MAGMSYAPTANYNGPATLTIVTSDLGNTGAGGPLTDTDTVNITVNAIDDAPVNSVPAAQTTNEDTALVFSAGNSNLVSISDVDAGAATVQTQLTVTNGTLSLSGVAGLTFVGGANGTATMTVQGTIGAINTAMAGMSYAPTANYNGPATLTIVTSDLGNTGAGGPLTDTDTVNITVNAIDDAPVNSVPAAQSTNEDTALVFSAGNSNLVSISDVDAGAATVQTQLTVTNGTLSLSGVAGLTFVGGANGTATMTVQGTIGAINTAMAGMSYAPTANYNGPATLTIVTSDLGNTGAGGPLTDTDTVNITVNAIDDAPVNSVPAAQSTNEDTALVFSAGNSNLVSISDVDAGAATVQTQLTVTNGTLSLSGVAGLTFVGGANGTATMTVQGTIGAINTAMAGMSYAPTANYNGPATLTIVTSDLGNTGAGGPLTDTDTVNITVNAVDDAPVNSVPAAQSTNEDTALVFSAGNSNLVSISDVDAGAATVQTQLTVTNGTLSLSGVAGLTFVGGANGTATMTVQGTIGAINTAMAGMSYAPTANYNGPATLTIVTSDLGNTGAGGPLTDTDTVNITVNAMNDAPTRVAGAVTNLTVLEDSGTTSLGLGALGYSPGPPDEAGQTLTYTVTAVPASTLGDIVLADGSTVVTAGTSYTLTELQGMQFRATVNANGGPAGFSWNVTDNGGTANGGVDTLTEFLTINVTSVNDAPAGTDATVTTLEDTAYVFTAADFGFTDPSDVPANSLAAVTITTLPPAGTLTDNGVAVLAGQFVALADIAGGLLQFTPAANANGAGYASFTFQVQDNGGTANAGVDLDPTPNTITVNVTSVNDAPAGTDATVTTLEDTAYVFTAADFGFTDPSDVPANSLAAVTISTLPPAGTLTDNGVAVLAGQFVALADIAGGLLQFTPAANANGAGYASFTFQVQDNGGTANAGVDLDPTPNTITVNVTSVNDAPAGTDATVTTLEDTAYVFTAADFGFTDPSDVPANSLAAVTISTLPLAGTLTDNGVAVLAGQFDRAGRHRRRAAPVHPGGQRQRRRLRELHLPGAGQRRHRQRRGRPRPDAQHDHGERHQRQRCAGGHRCDRHHARGHRLRLHRGRLRLHRPERCAGQQPRRGHDHHPADGRHAHRQRRGGARRPIRRAGRHRRRAAPVHPGGQRQRRRLRELHLPGAGQRRHRQRRSRPRPDAQHDHGERHQRQRCAGGHRCDRHHARGHRLRLHRGRLRLHRPERCAGQQPRRGHDQHPADWPARSPTTAWPCSPASRSRWPTSPAGCSSSPRRPTPTAPATRASPSRCRTTAAPPTPESTSTRRPTRSR